MKEIGNVLKAIVCAILWTATLVLVWWLVAEISEKRNANYQLSTEGPKRYAEPR